MRINKELLKGSTATLVLQIISQEESYGYQIAQVLAQKTQNMIQLQEGTLYPILHSLEKEGFLESFKKKTMGGRERRYYRITSTGRLFLTLKLQEWSIFSKTVDRVLQENS